MGKDKVLDNDSMHARHRFDFVIVKQSTDDTTRTATFTLRPDPARYETRAIEGETYYYDRLDDVLIPDRMVADMLEKAPTLPFSFSGQRAGDAAAYVEGRKANIRAALNGDMGPFTFADPSDEFLSSLETNKLEFVILSLDLVGSTRLATTLSHEDYVRVIQTVLFEISELVPLFHVPHTYCVTAMPLA
jgi:hypothetical protein